MLEVEMLNNLCGRNDLNYFVFLEKQRLEVNDVASSVDCRLVSFTIDFPFVEIIDISSVAVQKYSVLVPLRDVRINVRVVLIN
jgi:hypothetical protein